MNKIKSQVSYNLKKDKKSYISFGIVVLITAIMLNLALVLVFQVDNAYDKKLEKMNTATINVCIPKAQNTNILMSDIEALEDVSEVECREAVFLEAVVNDFRGTDFSMNTMFYNMDEFRDINKLEIKEESVEMTEQSIYLPLYVASFGEFGLEDEIVYEVLDKKHTFIVSGVLEEMQYGNYGKGLMGAYLPENVYNEFAREYEENVVIEYSIIAGDGTDIKDLYNEIVKLLDEQGITMLTSCDKESTKDTRTMVCNLLILVLLVFALVILLVSVFLCKFRISISIEEDMINMGVLKALGYTGNMIIGSMVLPYIMITVIAALFGVIASYGILPILSEVLTLQAGFSFNLLFDIKALICVEIILVLIVVVFTYTGAKRIKKLQPINAIRGNGEVKKFKIFVNAKQNVLLFSVSFVLTILVAFASTLFYNVIVKPNNFISTLSEEMPDIILYPDEKYKDNIINDLPNFSSVENVLEYTVGVVNIDDEPITVFACEDFSKVSNDLCYLGENPKEKNQIALGSAFEGKYKLGDQIEIYNGNTSFWYEITGFVQSVNYQGKVCEFSLEGYKELSTETVTPSLYLYLEDSADAESVINELEANYGDKIKSQVNYQKMTETTKEMYSGLASIIVVVIFVLTILIVLFVLYIVVKTLLVQQKQELGIYKAIGYSNWQLIFKMVGGFIPSSVLAVLISSVLGLLYVPEINQFIFQTVGAMKNNMEVSFVFLMIFALIQIVVNFIISISLTMPIKKISAYALIKED